MTPFAPGFGKRVSPFNGVVFSPGVDVFGGIYGGGVISGGVGVGGVGGGGGGVSPGVFGGWLCLNTDHGITIGNLAIVSATVYISESGICLPFFSTLIEPGTIRGFVQFGLIYKS